MALLSNIILLILVAIVRGYEITPSTALPINMTLTGYEITPSTALPINMTLTGMWHQASSVISIPPVYENPCVTHFTSIAICPLRYRDESSACCSTEFSLKWYRFQSGEFNTIPAFCPTGNNLKCGKSLSGWITLPHPTLADGIVSRTLCFSTIGNCSCHHSVVVSVANCGNFSIYRIPNITLPNLCLSVCGIRDRDEYFNNKTGTIFSPNFPFPYGNNEYKKYYILNRKQSLIKLSFDSFNTESGRDYVTIYDGLHTSATTLAATSGNRIPNEIITRRPGLLITFRTDFSKTMSGFRAHYKIMTQALTISSISCKSSYMRVTFRINAESRSYKLYLNDANCGIRRWFSFKDIPLNSCGTQLTENSNEIIYKNSLTLSIIDHRGSIDEQWRETFECHYPRNKDTFKEILAKPYETVTTGTGELGVSLHIYKDRSLTTRYESHQFPVSYEIGNWIYFGLSTQADTRLLLIVKECYYSDSLVKNNNGEIFLIRNRCPVSGYAVTVASTAREKKFAARVLGLPWSGNHVYLHCSISFCTHTSSSACSDPSCYGRSGFDVPSDNNEVRPRQKREADDETTALSSKTYLLSQGPFHRRQNLQAAKIITGELKEFPGDRHSTVLFAGGVIAFVAAAAVLIATLSQSRRRSTTSA